VTLADGAPAEPTALLDGDRLVAIGVPRDGLLQPRVVLDD
jgi:hypothetical protein